MLLPGETSQKLSPGYRRNLQAFLTMSTQKSGYRSPTLRLNLALIIN